MPKSRFIKAGIVAVPILLFLGLLFNYLGLSGVKTVHYVVGDSSPFIQSLLPSERTGAAANGAQKLLDEPVYFSVFAPPGNWETADVKVSFTTGSRAVLELGALKDLFAQAYDFRPLANTVIENLEAQGWTGRPVAKLGENIDAFVRSELVGSDPSAISDSQIAVYRASLPWAPPKNPVKLPKNYSGNTFSYPVQGPQEFFVYKYDGGPSNFSMNYFDGNLVAGSDEIAVRVYNQAGEIVAQTAAKDDGDTLADGKSSGIVELPKMPPLFEGLPEGVYRVSVAATSDIWFQDIVTPSPYMAFKNSLTISFPTCATARPAHDCDLALNTNAKAITLQPLDADALVPVSFGASTKTLDTVGLKTQMVSSGRTVSPLIIQRKGKGGTVKITADGFFSLATNPFFSPEPSGFSNFLAAPEDYKAIIAYFPPQMKEGDWRVASSSFDLSALAQERGAYKFVLSAPLVKEKDGDVTIHAIDITFKKPPLTLHSLLSSLKSFIKDLIW